MVLKDRKGCEKVVGDFKELTSQLSEDVEFVTIGIKNAKESYGMKKKQKNVAE